MYPEDRPAAAAPLTASFFKYVHTPRWSIEHTDTHICPGLHLHRQRHARSSVTCSVRWLRLHLHLCCALHSDLRKNWGVNHGRGLSLPGKYMCCIAPSQTMVNFSHVKGTEQAAPELSNSDACMRQIYSFPDRSEKRFQCSFLRWTSEWCTIMDETTELIQFSDNALE